MLLIDFHAAKIALNLDITKHIFESCMNPPYFCMKFSEENLTSTKYHPRHPSLILMRISIHIS